MRLEYWESRRDLGVCGSNIDIKHPPSVFFVLCDQLIELISSPDQALGAGSSLYHVQSKNFCARIECYCPGLLCASYLAWVSNGVNISGEIEC